MELRVRRNRRRPSMAAMRDWFESYDARERTFIFTNDITGAVRRSPPTQSTHRVIRYGTGSEGADSIVSIKDNAVPDLQHLCPERLVVQNFLQHLKGQVLEDGPVLPSWGTSHHGDEPVGETCLSRASSLATIGDRVEVAPHDVCTSVVDLAPRRPGKGRRVARLLGAGAVAACCVWVVRRLRR
ncbi:hypothetical protein BSKO_12696 [Bryopsis sp. KO-2023]|nr:hypothetical protein BSKO_12696 [Bryopsis sp. KO-2023]